MSQPVTDRAPDTASPPAASQLAQMTMTVAKTKARKRSDHLLMHRQVMRRKNTDKPTQTAWLRKLGHSG